MGQRSREKKKEEEWMRERGRAMECKGGEVL